MEERYCLKLINDSYFILSCRSTVPTRLRVYMFENNANLVRLKTTLIAIQMILVITWDLNTRIYIDNNLS